MPAAVAAAIVSEVVTSYVATTFASTLVAHAIGAAAGMVVGSALRGKPDQPQGAAGFTAQAQNRTQVLRSSVANRTIVYGRAVVSGPLVWAAATSDKNTLYLVIPVAGHEIDAVEAIYFNDAEVGARDGSGNVTSGAYAGHATIVGHLGTADQAADSMLVAAGLGWTADHLLRGVAYLAIRLTWNQDVYPRGIPNIKAKIRGKKLYDPRTATTAWSDNWALAVRDYVTSSAGLAATASEIDDATFIASANLADEVVDVTGQTIDRGYRATVNQGGAGAEAYNAVLAMFPPAIFSSSAFNFGALAAQAVANAAGSIQAQIDAAKTEITTRGETLAEPRYTCNGVVDLGSTPRNILEQMLSAGAGVTTWMAGTYRLFGGAWTAPAVELTADDLRGPVKVRAKIPRQQLFNAVRGTFVDPSQSWQPTDYPVVTNATYAADDGGDVIWHDLTLPMTTSAATAQRLAKIRLERSRQGITVEFPAKLTAVKLTAWDTCTITLDHLGWSGKAFRVLDWRFAPGGGVDLVLQEDTAASYDWSAEETTRDPAPDTNLPDPFTVAAPGVPAVAESLYETREGGGVKARATVSWGASDDAFVARYRLEYRSTGATGWTVLPDTTDLSFDINDIAPGRYDLRVKAINTLGVGSAYATRSNLEIVGLAAPPAAVSGLGIQAAGGLAVLTFALHPDLDVRIGGKIRIRHSASLTGATWETSTSIGEAVTGTSTVAVLPLKEGTYLLKAEDSSGILSVTAAGISTKQATALAWSTLDTVQEDDDFTGTHADTVREEIDGVGVLQLESIGLIDDQPDFDAIDNLAAIGGIQPEGTYNFATGMDLGSVQRVRLTSTVAAQIINANDQIDSRAADIDTWADVDGTVGAGADAWVEVRDTDDDPAGSPAWSDWRRLDAAEFVARGFDFRARLTTPDPAYNIQVAQLRVVAEQIA